MYLNDKYIRESGFTIFDVAVLQLIKQQRTEDLEDSIAMYLTDEMLAKFEERALIEQIKGKKDDSEIARIRLTKKGNKFLDDVETAEVEEQDIILFDWLEEFYKTEGKMIGNKKRTKTGIAHFRKHTGIEKNFLAALLKAFITDEENMKYNNKLENAFYSSKNLYSRKFNLDECRIYTYYDIRKKWFDKKFDKVSRCGQ